MKIQTKLFGTASYSIEDGATFETTKELQLKGFYKNCYIDIFEGLDAPKLEKAIMLLDNLEELDRVARDELSKAYDNDNKLVCDFINEHFNDYGDEVAQEIFEKLAINKQDDKKFLDNMEIGTIVAYEEASLGICIAIDYNLIWLGAGDSFTDQLLVITFNSDMKFLAISHES